ncbi:MAG: asparagine synthase (glutamine-hydrolyzing) [Bacteroidota bacterium]|nr:asparagine synthase (glutamine-hydrolyzing) [Bacteroidota bacterium]MDP4213874.1 asparagine synthase (glutamine-hydrolyzing) [Bacteroidota bacterium]
MPRIADIYRMCGIAGIISSNPQQVNQERLKKMTDMMVHRGPDGEGHWVNKTSAIGLGHRRLSIVDLSARAAQPMHYLDRYTIVHNGEIYNYIELKKELEGKGYAFISQSDTEVIMAAYDCWKEKCLQYFDGMFAFAVWDEQEQMLFAARDRFGEKPFYYWFNGQELIFASEMKALWAAGVEKQVNEKLLFNFITLGYTQNPGNAAETVYHQIHKLPAASFFIYRIHGQKNIDPVKYWRIETNQINQGISEEDAINRFTALFTQSIKNRLRSDVPLGTSLSGGLDSSSIAAMIQQLRTPGSPLQTFSAIFPGFESDESAYIKLLAAQKRITNFTVQPTTEGFIADFEKLCYYQEGLMGSASVYAQYKVFELAKQHNIKVLLDGQGADEVLAGYHKYYHWYWQQLYKKDKGLLQDEITAARQLGVQDEWNWKNKLSATWPAYAGVYLKNARQRKQLQSGDIEKQYAAAFGISYYELPPQNSLNNVLYYNTCNNGLEELLHYADRNGMAHGREVRLPFLHHELVEFVFSLPGHFKIKDGRTKWLLRKAMENLLPAAITWRKDKTGFEPPQKEWMQHAVLQDYIQEAKRELVEKGVLKKEVLNKKIQPLSSYTADNFDWRYLVAARLF